MAKGKKGNPTVNAKKENVNKLMEKVKAAKAKSAEEQWKELLTSMSEEEAKLFVEKLDVTAKETELSEREDAIKAMQDAFREIETELDRRDGEQNELRDKLDGRESDIQTRENAVSMRERETDRRDTALMNRERDIIEREINAENEFALQNRKALEVLRKRKEELDGEILALEQRKIEKEDELEGFIENLRKKKIEDLNAELERFAEERRTAAQSEADQIIETAKEVVASRHESISNEMEALKERARELDKQKKAQDSKEDELATRELNLQFGEAELKTEKEDIPTQIQIGVEKKVGALQNELTQARKDKEHLKKRLEECESKLLQYQDQEREADGMTMTELLEKNAFYKQEKARLEKELARRDEVLQAEYKVKAEKYDELDTKYIRLLEEHKDLERQQAQWMLTTSQLETEREKCLIAEKRREALQASIEKYEQEVNRFRSLYEQPKELAGRLESIETPHFKRRQMAVMSITETEWLDKIYANCEEAGIRFNKRLLYSFHTALKTADWSPITVLAGVSGTGKSLLPEYYCRFGGIYFMSMAVQPDWDSPQSLFGYFNSVDNRFNATTLIRAMVQFSNASNQVGKNSNLSDSMFIVLLDEMNLAHVELYFSDMLSKLERRRNSDDEIDVEIDLGAGMPKYPLELNDNILWVGTMNEDETTKALSDKVLDRGNLLSFPRPKEFISRAKANSVEAASMLQKSTWQSWLEDNVIEAQEFIDRIDKYKKGLEAINEAMEFAGRALGHRVWQSIENYMANHPKVISAIKAESFDTGVCDLALQEAFEEALVHKVMPKLRGIETDGETKIHCIKPIENCLFGTNGKDGLAPGLQADFNHAITNAYETFIWSSAKYLEIEE